MQQSHGCKGWNYHVWSIMSDRCTMCGRHREDIAKEVSGDADNFAASSWVKCSSRRSREKLYRLCGGQVPDYFTVPGFTHYHQVPNELIEEAVKITGVTLGKPRGELCKSWSFA